MTTILIISPEAWDGHFVSKHHYAMELARRGHDIIFYGPPSLDKKICLEDICEIQGRLRILRAPRVAIGLRRFPATIRRIFERRWLHRLERRIGQRIDVIWNFENSRFFDFRFAGDRLKIYQQVDLNQNFQPDVAASTANLSIAVSAPIEQLIAPFANQLVRITHGYAPIGNRVSLPNGLEPEFAKKGVNAVLTGNLDISYLDVDLVARLVNIHPDVQFHFVGSFTAGKGLHALTGSVPNVKFWGRRPAAELGHFLRLADVLLVAYQADEHLAQLANPHKIMEYLASGRCVLATRTLEYEGRSDLLEMRISRDAYVQAFTEIVKNPSDWNTPELIAHRQNFAVKNTYSEHVNRIAQEIGPLGLLLI
ncbi:glycosyltransferase [Marinobacter sp. M-5]|uniref:glycosyltransferase n=1 Tax=Marinobacter sp. M-5 TaxID=3081089 RepID=UPI00293D00AE|nr:glycosyltransferase [Marinobacter sp. M-5]MDV3503092.1 glycosyltransferase [Marinobacter sp. M-5]